MIGFWQCFNITNAGFTGIYALFVKPHKRLTVSVCTLEKLISNVAKLYRHSDKIFMLPLSLLHVAFSTVIVRLSAMLSIIDINRRRQAGWYWICVMKLKMPFGSCVHYYGGILTCRNCVNIINIMCVFNQWTVTVVASIFFMAMFSNIRLICSC